MKNKNQFSKFSEVEKRLGYKFNNVRLLEQAFTRSSYAEENGDVDNEVLEFIGDSVLGVLIVKHISNYYRYKSVIAKFRKRAEETLRSEGSDFAAEDIPFQSELDEAELSKMKIEFVRRESLAAATERCGFQEWLIMGKSDTAGNVQNETSVKEDLFEALIGAMTLDSKWDLLRLEEIVIRLLEVDRVLEEGFSDEPDYEKELAAWFSSHGKVLRFESCPSICENLEHGTRVDLGVDMLSFIACGYGKTERGARRMAAKRAMAFIGKTNDMAEKIRDAVGVPDYDRAVNQLQELWQKHLIPMPEYVFQEHGRAESGNPQWMCHCKIEGIYECENGGYVCDSKGDAKKAAAFEAMCYLFGTDVLRGFIENGEKISKEGQING